MIELPQKESRFFYDSYTTKSAHMILSTTKRQNNNICDTCSLTFGIILAQTVGWLGNDLDSNNPVECTLTVLKKISKS